jgi:hypothetical protein
LTSEDITMSAHVVKLTIDGQDGAQADLDAEALRQAILDAVPRGTKVTRVRGDRESMQFGEAIIVDIVSVVIVKAIFEGIQFFQQRRKVQIELETAGKVLVIDQVKPELATIIEQHLAEHSVKE